MNNKRNIKILIVDDDLKSLQILGNLLKIHEYIIEFAKNGEEALRWLSKVSFDLILLDVSMPGMDGFEVCKQIKSNAHTNKTPVIFLTAIDDEISIIKGFEYGAVDYITKPFKENELLARIATQAKIKIMQDDLINYSNDLLRKNNYITESIKYARNIQRTILPDIEQFKKHYPETFLIYKPKEIVSGDFYWYKNFEDELLIAVIDCTGHGVPGAIMSMVGYLAINSAVNDTELKKPNEILNFMHGFLFKYLNKEDSLDSLTDGMDVSLALINKKTNRLLYAGANRPLLIGREGKFIEIKGNPWSVGDLYITNKFTMSSIKLQKEDVLYLFSDGYIDQFGGEKDKKYGIKRFRELLINISMLNIAEQEKILIETHNKWKNNSEQLDDITVLGIKI